MCNARDDYRPRIFSVGQVKETKRQFAPDTGCLLHLCGRISGDTSSEEFCDMLSCGHAFQLPLHHLIGLNLEVILFYDEPSAYEPVVLRPSLVFLLTNLMPNVRKTFLKFPTLLT